jgi:hypothetical protein
MPDSRLRTCGEATITSRLSDSARLVVVPVHGNRDLPTGILRAILRQAELTADELADLL